MRLPRNSKTGLRVGPTFPSEIKYLTAEDVIEVNKTVLREIKAKKADKSAFPNLARLRRLLEVAEGTQGDIYDKAAVMLEQLIRGHPFVSGNRRTAFTATLTFLKSNGEQVSVTTDDRILIGIREGFYDRNEIKDWLKGHAIRKFTRR